MTGNGRDRDDGADDVDATLSIARQVQRDFDHVAGVRAGDEELIARAVDRVLVGPAPAVLRRANRRVAVMLGLGVALFASAAAAVWTVRSVVRSADGPSDEPVPAARAPRSRHGAGARGAAPGVTLPPPVASVPLAAPDSAPPAVPEVLPDPPPRASPALAPAPAGSPAATAPRPASRSGSGPPPTPIADSSLAPPSFVAAPSETAADLFRRANDARRTGDVSVARALYRDVVDRFPGSAEARLVRVSMGKLLLGAGDVRAAEAEFALYLAGDGPLVQEALVGRAECLRRLARPDDERRVWQRLLDEFPSGVYEPQARSRLAELGGGAGNPTPTPIPTP